mgnify:FL=1
MLYLLEKELRKQDYLVLSLSFEAADEYFESLGSLAEGLSLDIEECLREQNVDEKVLEEWNHSISERFPMRSLGTKISNLCRKCGKKVVLMIDEVDKSSDNQIFLSFLGLLREKYLKCQQGKDVTFHSVILAGVYDIKTLNRKGSVIYTFQKGKLVSGTYSVNVKTYDELEEVLAILKSTLNQKYKVKDTTLVSEKDKNKKTTIY